MCSLVNLFDARLQCDHDSFLLTKAQYVRSEFDGSERFLCQMPSVMVHGRIGFERWMIFVHIYMCSMNRHPI